jgi:hypothetical protein
MPPPNFRRVTALFMQASGKRKNGIFLVKLVHFSRKAEMGVQIPVAGAKQPTAQGCLFFLVMISCFATEPLALCSA